MKRLLVILLIIMSNIINIYGSEGCVFLSEDARIDENEIPYYRDSGYSKYTLTLKHPQEVTIFGNFNLYKHDGCNGYSINSRHLIKYANYNGFMVVSLKAGVYALRDEYPGVSPLRVEIKGTNVSSSTVIDKEIKGIYGANFFYFDVLGSSKEVTITTEGSTDTIGYLYDNNFNLIKYNDDSFRFPNYNFKIVKKLSIGRYYIRVNGYRNKTGKYKLKISQKGVLDDPSGNYPGKAISFPSIINGSILQGGGDIDIYHFDIEGNKRQSVKISFTGDKKKLSLRNRYADIIDYELNSGSSLEEFLEPGRYYIVVEGDDWGSDGAGDYQFKLGEPSDQGCSISTATDIGVRSTKYGVITDYSEVIEYLESTGAYDDELENYIDCDMFRFNITENQTVKMLTESDTDTIGSLLDSNGQLIEWNDDSGDNSNFKIEKALNAGTYYIKVEGYRDGRDDFYPATGSYMLKMSTDAPQQTIR